MSQPVYSSDKDLNKLVKELLAEGWTFSKGNGHGKIKTPCGRRVVSVSSSPSSHRVIKAMRTNIARIKKELAHD